MQPHLCAAKWKKEAGIRSYSRSSCTLCANRILGGYLDSFPIRQDLIFHGHSFPSWLVIYSCTEDLPWSSSDILFSWKAVSGSCSHVLVGDQGHSSAVWKPQPPWQWLKSFGEEQRVEAISPMKNGYSMQLLSLLLCTIGLYFPSFSEFLVEW